MDRLLILSLLCLFRLSNSFPNTQIKDFPWGTVELQTKYGFIHGAKNFIGIGDEPEQTGQYFQFNFGMKESVVGNVAKVDWGIQCKDTAIDHINSCSVISNTIKEDFYLWMRYIYKDAELYLRPDKRQVIDTEDKKKLKVRLVEGGQRWPLSSLGVVGLSPQSDFAEYYKQLYDDDFSIMFGYFGFKYEENKLVNFYYKVVQNPQAQEKYLKARYNLGKDKKFWSLNGDLHTPLEKINLSDATFCFSSLNNNIILVEDSEFFCSSLLESICDVSVAECKRNNIDFTQVSDFHINLYNFTFSFTISEFLYFDNEGLVKCGVEDIDDYKSLQICPENTKVVIGKLFYKKYLPMLTFVKDGSCEISFYSYYRFDKQKNYVYWLIFTPIVILLIAVLAFVIYKLRKPQNDEYYIRSDNQDSVD